MQPCAQPHRFQHGLGLCAGSVAVHAANPKRHGHVVKCAEFRQQMMELIDKTQVLVAQLAQCRGVQTRQGLAHQRYVARGRLV